MSKVLVTGGCGFIGSTLARRLLAEGHEVFGLDNLSRKGVETHYTELSRSKLFHHRNTDIIDAPAVELVFKNDGPFDAVFHLCAQTAVTTSYEDRTYDFQCNAIGSFNILENVKRCCPEAYCLYSSTNKVYGKIEVNSPVGAEYTLDPYTPYGVSKAVGDLYFQEYGRAEIGLKTCILRQSCIYGENQYGVEDQGWLAWFAVANILKKRITIFGNGQQVRDLLYVTDLVDLFLGAWKSNLTGAFPVGGGAENAINLADAIQQIETANRQPFIRIEHDVARAGDQPYFVADNTWVNETGLEWKPSISIAEGLDRLLEWLNSRRPELQRLFTD